MMVCILRRRVVGAAGTAEPHSTRCYFPFELFRKYFLEHVLSAAMFLVSGFAPHRISSA